MSYLILGLIAQVNNNKNSQMFDDVIAITYN